MNARTHADVDDMVRHPDRLLVMLDDDDGIAEITQVGECPEQALVVALVEPDGWLVENIHDADEPRADLARKPDALGLAAREGFGAALQGEVVQADVNEKTEPLVDLLDDLGRDLTLLARQ